MWGPILGGFTILGVFLTFSAWINGRSIKRYIGELIKEESKASRELMERMEESTEVLLSRISEQQERFSLQQERLSQQHEEMIKLLTREQKTFPN